VNRTPGVTFQNRKSESQNRNPIDRLTEIGFPWDYPDGLLLRLLLVRRRVEYAIFERPSPRLYPGHAGAPCISSVVTEETGYLISQCPVRPDRGGERK